MIRICNSLNQAGFDITLIGTKSSSSLPTHVQNFKQHRINCLFKKGSGFYAEYNIKLFLKLLFLKCDAICCIDLDTMVPVYFSGKFKNTKLIYDAHEYFSELKEVATRKNIHRFWHFIEQTFVPQFKYGYTVCFSIADIFKQKYKVEYQTIMNATVLKNITPRRTSNNKILYQGAVNEARGLEFLIPAMQNVDAILDIYGDGNYIEQIKSLIKKFNLEEKVILKGKLLPNELNEITSDYYIGINLIENVGLNQYYSLANKFFDYIHAEIPQITMNFPEYKKINDEREVAICIDNFNSESISNAINNLINDKIKYESLKLNCTKAKLKYNWQNEEKKLIAFYKSIFG
jgi:glycosyltransferase involved in cell wall biosynthesis